MFVPRLSTYNYPWPDEVTIATGRLGRCCWRCWCLPCYRLWTRCASSSAADDSAGGGSAGGGGGSSGGGAGEYAGAEGDIESCGGSSGDSDGGGDEAAAGASSDSLVPSSEEMERGGGLSEIGGPRVGEEPSAVVREAGLTPEEEEQWRNVHHFIRNRAGSGAMIPSDAGDSCAVTSTDCDSTGAGTKANGNEATRSATMNLYARLEQRQQLKRAGSM
jgi:hypothetical protein